MLDIANRQNQPTNQDEINYYTKLTIIGLFGLGVLAIGICCLLMAIRYCYRHGMCCNRIVSSPVTSAYHTSTTAVTARPNPNSNPI
jgi:hypothetical protein